MILELGMEHQGLKVYKVYINDDHVFTCFTERSHLGKMYFYHTTIKFCNNQAVTVLGISFDFKILYPRGVLSLPCG